MAIHDGKIPCAEDGCEESFQNHRWGRIKADQWFQQKDGRSWCPAHIPAWVEAWRAQRASPPPSAAPATNTESEKP